MRQILQTCYATTLVLPVLLGGCAKPCPETSVADLVKQTVLTEQEQAELTAPIIIEKFMEGNRRFCNGQLTVRDHSLQVRHATQGQYPKAVVLSCADSRIPIEDVFDMGIGDLLVARVAGNIVNEDILGSMEFGCAVTGAKVIVVMGHENCGAVKASIEKVATGNITALATKIGQAIDSSDTFAGERTSANKAYVHHVCVANVKNTIRRITAESTVLADLEKAGKVTIVGAIYDLDTGAVTFL